MTRILLAAALLAAHGTSGPQEPPARAGLSAWDTGTPSEEPLAPAALEARAGWSPAAAAAAFRGDAVLTSGRLTAVARQRGRGLEVYSGTALRARLLPGPGAEAGAIQRFSIAEITRGAAVLDVGWKAAAVRFRLKRGDLAVEARASSGDAPLRIECPARFLCLPDFFADDILVDARKIPPDRVELPTDSFVLHFAGRGDAIAMAVFENRNQEARATLSGQGDGRTVTGTEIDFGKDGKIWLALLDGPGTWHAVDVAAEDAKKVLPLEWTMPFPAAWRVDFTRKDDLTDSWEMLLPEKEGNGYFKPSWLGGNIPARTASGTVDARATNVGGPVSDRVGPERKRWTTVLGWMQYPCWTDREGRGFLQPPQHKRLSFRGPALLYPVNRVPQTPLDAYTVVDAVRNTLGVGPCEYILDVEGQKEAHVGRATCTVSDLLVEIFKKGEQKARRKEMEGYLQDGLDFITHIRNRIAAYVAFGRELRGYLSGQRAGRPEIKEFLDEMEALAGEIDARVEPRLKEIQGKPVLREIAEQIPAAPGEIPTPAYAVALNKRFVETLIEYAGADWAKKLEGEYTLPLRHIGGNQDEMVGECRWVVRALRQKAALRAAADPRVAPVAAEIRARTQKILRGGAAYEGARH